MTRQEPVPEVTAQIDLRAAAGESEPEGEGNESPRTDPRKE